MTVKFDRDAGVRGNRRAMATWFVMGLIAALFVVALPYSATGALPNPPLFELDGNAITDHATAGIPDDWDRAYCSLQGVTLRDEPGRDQRLVGEFRQRPSRRLRRRF